MLLFLRLWASLKTVKQLGYEAEIDLCRCDSWTLYFCSRLYTCNRFWYGGRLSKDYYP